MKRIATTLLAVFALLAVVQTAEAQPWRGYNSGYYYYPYTTGYYGPAYTNGYVLPGSVVTSSSYYPPSTVVTPSTSYYYPSTTYYPSTSYYYPTTSYYYPSPVYYSSPLGTRIWIGR